MLTNWQREYTMEDILTQLKKDMMAPQNRKLAQPPEGVSVLPVINKCCLSLVFPSIPFSLFYCHCVCHYGQTLLLLFKNFFFPYGKGTLNPFKLFPGCNVVTKITIFSNWYPKLPPLLLLSI